MTQRLCIYHGHCADGFGAAWVVRKFFGDDIEFYAGVHQQPPPDVTGKEVIMVDFSYKRPVILEMAKAARSILIIDHHQTAAADLLDLPAQVQTVFDMEHSGATLTWRHYFDDQEPPRLLQHVEDRDLWRFKLSHTQEIMAALYSYPMDFSVWDELMTDTQKLAQEGAAIDRKQRKDVRELIQSAAYRGRIAGHDVPLLNAPHAWASDAGNLLAKGEPFSACYWHTQNSTCFSLRSAPSGLDVSAIAVRFGGGGHKHAAGFTVAGHDLSVVAEA